MGGLQVFAATMVMIGVLGAVLISVRPQRVPQGRSVADIRRRISAERAPVLAVAAPTLPHGAPDRPLEVPEAHRVMQQHLDCAVASCPRKAAAYDVLIAAGRLKPR
ncbi:hypothetical protein [Nocardia terpenica]|uniref:Uncharacterized protein n=1 Tax=Nocardia terpenica TaxID=455432 RepID=A0A6G9Z8F3_9NOCA|nr:hypothetical protein [Nocardia terpenica]QIS21905.1 hypothetical protein F6W96_29820 [Nocardia terpenica]